MIHDRLRAWTRVVNEREPSPSEAIVDRPRVAIEQKTALSLKVSLYKLL